MRKNIEGISKWLHETWKMTSTLSKVSLAVSVIALIVTLFK